MAKKALDSRALKSRKLKRSKSGKAQLKIPAGQPSLAPKQSKKLPPVSPLNPDLPDARVLDRLWSTILSRKDADPLVSHSARLLSRGINKVAQKFGEESVECLIEAVAGNRTALVAESADVLYHLLVMLVASGIRPEEVWVELARREGVSGIAEKTARKVSVLIAETRKIP